MDIYEILKHTDHTNLSPVATREDIATLLEEGMKYNTASVCIAPSYVRFAKNYVDSRLKICTVIGFPNGYSTTESKVFEAEDAIRKGADEIDMVINLGMVRNRHYDEILREITAVRRVTEGKILKVIVETGLLSEAEKISLCEIVEQSGADFIKTSTGFLSTGAAFCDIDLFSRCIRGDLKIKASGGISSLDDAEKFLTLGAERLGTSKLVNLAKEII